MEQRTILQEVSSGKIELIWNGVFAAVQFNCSCLDALHVCHGMCCRRRVGYLVELQERERGHYDSVPHPTAWDIDVLATKKNGMMCVYQDENSGQCTIHKKRPAMCRQWHCSPGGEVQDKEIVQRDAGWMLTPVRKEEMDFVQLSMEGMP